LAGPTEVEAYVDLHCATFETKNMTTEWRTRTLTSPHHLSDADLVAVSPSGALAGSCVGWLLTGGQPTGQVEPLGIARECKEHGLGAALLTKCIRRLLAAGAPRILVETDTCRTPARDVLVYRRDVSGANAL
jgi:ribosomal protein S18 acetylase RimI-like enzyme